MRDLIVFALVFGSLPFILWRPYVGVLVWSWLAYMNPHRLTWSYAFDFPFSLAVAAVLIVSVVFSREPKKVPWTPVTVTWLVFFIWTWITTQFALVPWVADTEWSRWWKINLVSLITLMVMHGRHRLHLLAWIIALSLGFFGIKGGTFTILTGGSHMVLGPPLSFIGDNTSLGLAMIMALPFMRYLQLEARAWWLRWGLGGAMGLTALATLATHSRGALLGIVAMVWYLVWKSRYRVRVGLAVIALAPIMWTFMPENWHKKMGTIQTYEEDGSAMGRINAWWFAFNLAKDHPITGGGFRTFNPNLFKKYAPDPDDFHDAHSIYFEVLGEQGFIGLAIYLLLGYLAYRTGNWIIRKTRDGPEELRWAHNLGSMLQATLIGYAVSGAFLGLAYFDLYYTVVAMIVLTRVEVERMLAGAPARASAAGQLAPFPKPSSDHARTFHSH